MAKKNKAMVVHVPIPKHPHIRMMFEVATQLAGYPSMSKFFYAAAQNVAMELLEENAARIKEMEEATEKKERTQLDKEKAPEQVLATKQSACSHTDVLRMTSGSGEKVAICNECGKHLEE